MGEKIYRLLTLRAAAARMEIRDGDRGVRPGCLRIKKRVDRRRRRDGHRHALPCPSSSGRGREGLSDEEAAAGPRNEIGKHDSIWFVIC